MKTNNKEEYISGKLRKLDKCIIMILDEKGNVLDWNHGAEKLLGWKKKEVLGRNFSFLFTEEDRKSGLPAVEMETAIRKGRADDDNWILRKSKKPFWGSGVSVSIPEDGEVKRIMKIVRDATGENIDDITRDDFLSFMVHELRNSLNSINLNLELLNGEIEESDKEKYKTISALSKATLAEVASASRVTSDLRDEGEQAGRKIKYVDEYFDLPRLLREIASAEGSALKRQIKVSVDDIPIQIYADRGRIRQVIKNLINNAHKYSPENKEVEINASITNNTATVCIKDYGYGIKEAEKSKIFELYERGSSGRYKISGSGVGLFICRRILQHYGQKIWIENTEINNGTTMCFTLPLAE